MPKTIKVSQVLMLYNSLDAEVCWDFTSKHDFATDKPKR